MYNICITYITLNVCLLLQEINSATLQCRRFTIFVWGQMYVPCQLLSCMYFVNEA